LTKRSIRSVSATKSQPPPPERDASESESESGSDEEEEEEEEEVESAKEEEKPEPPSRGSTPLSHRVSNISNTSNLDVVNLDDDDATPQNKGTPLFLSPSYTYALLTRC
jgi:hypothetical protein